MRLLSLALLFVIAMPLASAQSSEPLVERAGNRVRIAHGQTGVDIEWIRPASVSVRHWWFGPPVYRDAITKESVDFEMNRRDASVTIVGKYLAVEVALADYRIAVRTAGGRVLFTEARGPERNPRTIVLRQLLDEGEAIYGMDIAPPSRESASLRGARAENAFPFFFSSKGYGRYFVSERRKASVDVGQGIVNRLDVTLPSGADQEQYVYLGPAPKEIFEEHMSAAGGDSLVGPASLLVLRAQNLPPKAVTLPVDLKLCDLSAGVNQASLSARLFPALPLESDAGKTQLAELFPLVFHRDLGNLKQPAEVAMQRAKWSKYLNTYLREAYDRGLPIIRPLLMQFPLDKGMDLRTDVFMIGDEVLAVPVCGRTEVALPRGRWTNLSTNEQHAGRAAAKLGPGAVNLFARNGSILPFAPILAGQPAELHYFPPAGAEFFVFEESEQVYSQFHAGPAGDLMRLEAESKVAGRYLWVAHHFKEPAAVGELERPYRRAALRDGLRPGEWFFDAAKSNLYVMIESAGGDDKIVNISY